MEHLKQETESGALRFAISTIKTYCSSEGFGLLVSRLRTDREP